MARKAKKSRIVSIDFTNVEEGGGGNFKIPEGPYRMSVVKVEEAESDAGNDMLKWTFKGLEKKAKGKTFYQYTTLNEEALWKLRSLLVALGVDVPKSPLDLDLDEMVDLELIGIVSDEEYRNKTSSKMTDFEPIGGADEEEDEEEEKPAKKEKKSKKEEPEDEEEEKPAKKGKKGKKGPEKKSADEIKAMDADELADVITEYELDVDLDDHKTLRRKASAVIAELEEKEMLEDE